MHVQSQSPMIAPVPLVPYVLPSHIHPHQLLGIDDRYVDFRHLGSGGRSDVFACYDQHLEIVVALKRLAQNNTSRESDRFRFLHEAQVLQRLESPSIPLIYEVHPERLYKPYFTMELITGVDLCRVLSGLRNDVPAMMELFPLPKLMTLVDQAADAIESAHAVGLVHRDIKPENLMVLSPDELRVVDWELAYQPGSQESLFQSPQSSSQSDRRRQTRVGEVPGTPLYMSPEQIRLQGDVDERSDIFSLGAVMYDCLALTTLVRGNSVEAVFEYILQGDYPAPSRVGLRSEVPPALEQICMRAIHPDREERYQTIRQFREDLAQAM